MNSSAKELIPAHIRVADMATKNAVRPSKNTSMSTGIMVIGTMYMPELMKRLLPAANRKNTVIMA